MSGTVAIGVASCDRPAWAFVDSLFRLQAPAGWRLQLIREGPLAVDLARNAVVKHFLRSDATWLLWLDSDAVVHPLTLVRLMSHGLPVVGALAFQRYGPCLPTMMRGRAPDGQGWQVQIGETREWLARHAALRVSSATVLLPAPDDALVEVDRTGCHCLLTHRRVYEQVAAPWFVGDPTRKHTREDMYFCERVQAAGFRLYVDRAVTAGHLAGDRPLGALDFLVWDAVSDYENGA